MAWIRTIAPGEATGLLKRLYDGALARAGKVFNVLRIQSLRPEVLRAGVALYEELMISPRSPLSRARREMIATAVSQVNGCHYWTDAHADDLRAEVADQGERGEALVAAVRSGAWAEEGSPLSAADRAMLAFAVKLAREPRAMTRGDVEALRAAGFGDTAIHDVVQIAGFFSYYNRLADGLGIDPEPSSAGHWDVHARRPRRPSTAAEPPCWPGEARWCGGSSPSIPAPRRPGSAGWGCGGPGVAAKK